MDISGFLSGLFTPLVLLLPAGKPLPIPSLAPVAETLTAIDALVPISPVITAALGLLGLLAVFLLVRAMLVAWNLIYP